MTIGKGPLGACAEYRPAPDCCDFKHGHCLSSMSAVIGRMLDPEFFRGYPKPHLPRTEFGTPTDEERTRLLAVATMMEGQARTLREAVKWVEAGHNGHGRDGADDLLTKGLKRAARAKPDGGGTCNGSVCVLAASDMVGRGLPSASGLTEALGSLEMKRILKAATQLEENADNLRAAIST